MATWSAAFRYLFLCVECVCAPNGRNKRTQREKPIKNTIFVFLLRIWAPRKGFRAPGCGSMEPQTTGQLGHASHTVGAVQATWQHVIGRACGRGRPDAVNAALTQPFHVAGSHWPAPTALSGRDTWRAIGVSGATWMAATCPGAHCDDPDLWREDLNLRREDLNLRREDRTSGRKIGPPAGRLEPTMG